ncbi:hypothetical protein MKW98_032321 [Papaver atlanticum]|uniref:Chlororespiratory reduction 4 n=1 Tax=Papaver atlanticum TaxID=357466 RepID=A0AAD4SEH6_9MAGN|nr:hypothetical protein MKW98_032321 [Papaver atlanticum]
MIECFLQKNCKKDAFFVYNSRRVSPNNFTFTFLFKSCQSYDDFDTGRELHAQVVKSGFGGHVFVQNTVLDFYSKCSENVGCALKVFEEMAERDVVSWNSMVCAYMNHGEMKLAIELFKSMEERNTVSWNLVISGLAKRGDMESARLLFEEMITWNVAVKNAKLGLDNEVAWNAMISGYMRNGDVKNARLIFDRMPVKSVVSCTAMISGYAKVGDVGEMNSLFNSMPVKNVITWNAMIAGFFHNHKFDQALEVFHRMLTYGECKPDETTLLSVLSACTHLGAHELGKWIQSYIQKRDIEISTPLGNALIDMFAKCGDLESAMSMFNQMRKKCIITWTSMVAGLAFNGQCKEALALFDEMCAERMQPDDVIFIAVLSACTHGGLVEEGKRVFSQMVKQFNIVPRIEHYGCMIDLLSRARKLEEAFTLITSMSMKPNAVIWATLLGSCKLYGQREMLEVLTKKILELEPSNPAYLMLISNLNASIGQWEDVLSVRAAMKKAGIEKVPGSSSIQVENIVHEFLVKDTKHENRMEIFETLDSLYDQLKTNGIMEKRDCVHLGMPKYAGFI